MRPDRSTSAFDRYRLIALVSGLLGFILALLTPLLPVEQDRATLDWPQAGNSTDVEAPLVSYEPQRLTAALPCSILPSATDTSESGATGRQGEPTPSGTQGQADDAARPGASQSGPSQSGTAARSDTAATQAKPSRTILSTIPVASGQAATKGLVVAVSDGTLTVVQRDIPLLSAPVAEIGGCTAITIDSTAATTTVEFTGVRREDGNPFVNTLPRDIRPQVVGIFTDLDAAQVADARVHLDIDSRFSSTPTLLKLLAQIAAVICTVIALIALHLLDTSDGRRARRFLPAHWWRFSIVDGAILGVLALWHIIGANTSDDGYILNMARASEHSGYMANYYRWFAVPEAPFGWSYEVLAWMTKISDASPWMRLPTLLAGVVCWLVISREVLPRLGARVRRDRVALWTAGLVFLAFWLPYDNGLRPEPLIAAGALLTWCSIERAIATGRLLPAAIGVLIAAFSLAAGPTGLICIAALIAGSRPVLQIIVKRAQGALPRRIEADAYAPGAIDDDGRRTPTPTLSRASLFFRYAALIAPGLAAGTLVLIVVFADQTLATVMEATRARTVVGPNVAWFDERTRWDSLLMLSPDGSLARRFGVLVMLLCLLVCVLQVLRKGRIPGTSRGPSVRILGIVFASLLLMMFTPTKWTHHFGVYAGLAGSLAALAAVAVGTSGIRVPRNRALFAAAVLFLLAITFTGSNGWWYVSSYGVPWWDKAPLIAGKGLSTLFLGLSGLALVWAVWTHYREPYREPAAPRRFGRFASAPLTIAAALLVVFELASLTKAALTQYPAYSIAKSNVEALGGDSCGLADGVLVETDTADSLLQPFDGSPADGLSAKSKGFTPNGVASDLTADAEETVSGGANSIDKDSANKTTNTTGAGTGGGTSERTGINGSTVALPFGLDPARTPVMGSYQDGEQQQAALESQWYHLNLVDSMRHDPAYRVLVVTAAGRIRSVDADGVLTYGQELHMEYGVRGADGQVRVLGSVDPLDIGPAPSWRNLRVPLDGLPSEVNAVRLVAVDNDITPKQWLAVTPPRLPSLKTLNSVVGSRDPVLLDWHVGLAFPCQRPFDHHDGVAEVPQWRILPDRVGSDASNAWQDDIGGGPLGWTGLLLSSESVPTYLEDDWGRDWGSLERFTPYDPDADNAVIDVTTVNQGGMSRQDPIRIR
ncbi:arabinosyltransferase domain-containing protein [Nocardia sp. NBC_01377]|uniref:arabinosyltransferase domain-containing protein n=1 Tax=Nocardia sp. NBC_01377 TaxID=2903595 RepID=UPI00325555F4